MRAKSHSRKSAFTLAELIISLAVSGVVIAITLSSALFFMKAASNHNNRAQFNRDMRMGFEKLAYDVRNASKVVSRSETGFTLAYSSRNGVTPSNVSYSFERASGNVVRNDGANENTVFQDVSDFDILTSSGDVGENTNLSYSPNTVCIEELRFEAANGAAASTELAINNFTFRIRNSHE